MSDPDRDEWERVGQTLDWVAGLIAVRLGREPADLVWPAVLVGLACGLSADGLNSATGEAAPVTLVAVSLTTCGFGVLALLARRLRGVRGTGGARTADAGILGVWLRRLQVLLAAVLVAVVGLLVVGAVIGAPVMVVRNVLEIGRIGAVVLALSWLLMDDEVGLPEWLANRQRSDRHAAARA